MKDLFGKQPEKQDEHLILKAILEKINILTERMERIEKQQEQQHKKTMSEAENEREIEQEEEETENIEEEHTPATQKEAKQTETRQETRTKQQQAILALQQNTIKTVSRNRKQILQDKIIDEARKQKPIQDIKIEMVDEQKYCSKATFYRYVSELKASGKITTLTVNSSTFIQPQE